MAALLLVPVVASGHAHRDAAGSGSCATCIAAHHSPATAPNLAVLAGAVFGAIALPLPTQVVIFLGTFMRHWWWAALAVIFVFVMGFRRRGSDCGELCHRGDCAPHRAGGG